MPRPKKKKLDGSGNAFSTYYHTNKGFNSACDKFDKFIPTKEGWEKYLQQNDVNNAILIADLIYKRLK